MKRDVSPNRRNRGHHKEEEQSGAHPSPFIVIFTDLDGTLLDHNSYGWQKAEPALRLCKENQIPLIPVSSKTRAEIRVLQQELGLSSPFVSENGGGVFFPKEGKHPHPSDAILSHGVWKWSIGPAYDFLLKALGEIRDEQGWKIRGFSNMTTEEISSITGLDLASARLASQREYDEPFILMEEEGACNMDALNHFQQVSSGNRHRSPLGHGSGSGLSYIFLRRGSDACSNNLLINPIDAAEFTDRFNPRILSQ